MDISARNGEASPLLQGKKANKSWSAWLSLLAPPLLIYVVGVVVLYQSEGWPLLTSAYVIAQMVTTVGYGDLTVQSDYTRVFMAFYALAVMCLFASYVQVFTDYMMDLESKALRSYLMSKQAARDGLSVRAKYASLNNIVVATVNFAVFLLFGITYYSIAEACTCGVEAKVGCNDGTYDLCVATGGYVKSVSESFYMSVITLTTIGFGDYQPRTWWGRCFAIPWMVFGVVAFANFVTQLAAFFHEERSHSKHALADDSPHLTLEAFDKIDRNKNGTLTRGEYLAFMLVKYGAVSEDLIEDIFRDYESYRGSKDNAVERDAFIERQRSNTAANQRDNAFLL